MINCEKILQKLKENGIKLTDQRKELIRILVELHRPVTAEEIFLLMKETSPDTCLATIYRNLDLFVSIEIVRQMQLSGKKREYELIGEEHYHYLVCKGCNKTIKLDDCPLHQYEKKIVADTDFTITEHRLAMYGYCPKCKERN